MKPRPLSCVGAGLHGCYLGVAFLEKLGYFFESGFTLLLNLFDIYREDGFLVILRKDVEVAVILRQTEKLSLYLSGGFRYTFNLVVISKVFYAPMQRHPCGRARC